jgi:hypothetical protein
VESNDAELVIETEFGYNWDGCVEHRFKKKPATKFRGDNAWVVEYLLDRFATQASLCDHCGRASLYTVSERVNAWIDDC